MMHLPEPITDLKQPLI